MNVVEWDNSMIILLFSVIKINARKATLEYVGFDGVTALLALGTMTEVLYTRYTTLFQVSMIVEILFRSTAKTILLENCLIKALTFNFNITDVQKDRIEPCCQINNSTNQFLNRLKWIQQKNPLYCYYYYYSVFY